MKSAAIAPELRPLLVASFAAYCRFYNLARAVIDWAHWDVRKAPEGVSLQDILLARYAQSVHECVQLLILDERLVRTDTLAFESIELQYGKAMAELVRARYTSSGGPSSDEIEAAALAFANRPEGEDASLESIHRAYTRGA